MLTKEASNALLKTLEEPPAHRDNSSRRLPSRIKCSDDPFEMPALRFKKLTSAMIVKQLQDICAGEGVKSDEEALYEIARAATVR
jgi:DNA polymerase-3 subunit gamma/tau